MMDNGIAVIVFSSYSLLFDYQKINEVYNCFKVPISTIIAWGLFCSKNNPHRHTGPLQFTHGFNKGAHLLIGALQYDGEKVKVIIECVENEITQMTKTNILFILHSPAWHSWCMYFPHSKLFLWKLNTFAFAYEISCNNFLNLLNIGYTFLITCFVGIVLHKHPLFQAFCVSSIASKQKR